MRPSFVAGAAILAGGIFSVVMATPKGYAEPGAFSQPTTFAELSSIKADGLEKVDMARMNLLCASGLPGTENMDVASCISTLDRYAAAVKEETERYLPQYHRNPAKFKNSEGYFRMMALITVLKQDLGVRYSDARQEDEAWESFFSNSRDLFLNGLLTDYRSGTCGSLPVLFAAVGRRLGYPLKLVSARSHLFVRWESQNDTFNIEGTNGGLVSHPDEYYKTWPKSYPEELGKAEGYLQSMTPQDELACFLDQRGMCLRANKRYAEAVEVYQACLSLRPHSLIYADKLKGAKAEAGQIASAR